MNGKKPDFGTPEAIFGVGSAFQQSRVLITAAQLDLFTLLSSGPQSVQTLAARLGANRRALTRVLDAVVAMGLLEKSGETYRNTPAAQAFLVRGAPESMLAALEHMGNMWERWGRLTEIVRTGKPAALPRVDDRGDAFLESFLGAMDALARHAAPQVAAAVGLSGVRRLLDVGGGAGSYAIAFARAEPALEAVVFDLPNVVPIAQRNIQKAGLAHRITTRAGDYHTDSLGSGFDLALLSAIVHSNTFEENARLVRKCYQALEPRGRLVIRDFIMSPDRTEPPAGALFAINMLVGTEGGGTYTEAEMREWMEDAGFEGVHRVDLPGMNALMIGRRSR
ncbi:MAG: methyltransferase [Armatimonadota bacterium]|nr:methyltransferase [Armatimonadota bacterium]